MTVDWYKHKVTGRVAQVETVSAFALLVKSVEEDCGVLYSKTQFEEEFEPYCEKKT